MTNVLNLELEEILKCNENLWLQIMDGANIDHIEIARAASDVRARLKAAMNCAATMFESNVQCLAHILSLRKEISRSHMLHVEKIKVMEGRMESLVQIVESQQMELSKSTKALSLKGLWKKLINVQLEDIGADDDSCVIAMTLLSSQCTHDILKIRSANHGQISSSLVPFEQDIGMSMITQLLEKVTEIGNEFQHSYIQLETENKSLKEKLMEKSMLIHVINEREFGSQERIVETEQHAASQAFVISELQRSQDESKQRESELLRTIQELQKRLLEQEAKGCLLREQQQQATNLANNWRQEYLNYQSLHPSQSISQSGLKSVTPPTPAHELSTSQTTLQLQQHSDHSPHDIAYYTSLFDSKKRPVSAAAAAEILQSALDNSYSNHSPNLCDQLQSQNIMCDTDVDYLRAEQFDWRHLAQSQPQPNSDRKSMKNNLESTLPVLQDHDNRKHFSAASISSRKISPVSNLHSKSNSKRMSPTSSVKSCLHSSSLSTMPRSSGRSPARHTATIVPLYRSISKDSKSPAPAQQTPSSSIHQTQVPTSSSSAAGSSSSSFSHTIRNSDGKGPPAARQHRPSHSHSNSANCAAVPHTPHIRLEDLGTEQDDDSPPAPPPPPLPLPLLQVSHTYTQNYTQQQHQQDHHHQHQHHDLLNGLNGFNGSPAHLLSQMTGQDTPVLSSTKHSSMPRNHCDNNNIIAISNNHHNELRNTITPPTHQSAAQFQRQGRPDEGRQCFTNDSESSSLFSEVQAAVDMINAMIPWKT